MFGTGEDFCVLVYQDETDVIVARTLSVTSLGVIHRNIQAILDSTQDEMVFASPLDIYVIDCRAITTNNTLPAIELLSILGDEDGLGTAWATIETLEDNETERLAFYHKLCTACETAAATRLRMRHDKDFSPIKTMISLL